MLVVSIVVNVVRFFILGIIKVINVVVMVKLSLRFVKLGSKLFVIMLSKVYIFYVM